MSQLFARVELRGTSGADVYDKLHAYMASKCWYQTITGTQTVALPHATYQGTYESEAPDVLAIAMALKSDIEATIWPKALVLVMQTVNWGVTAG